MLFIGVFLLPESDAISVEMIKSLLSDFPL